MTDDIEDAELDAGAGSHELVCAHLSIKAGLGKLARAFPSTTAICTIHCGEISSLYVQVLNNECVHISPVGMYQIRRLAQIIGRLDPMIRRDFEDELRSVPKEAEL
jgi:hypothetical protein